MGMTNEQMVAQLGLTFETMLAKWFERQRSLRDYNNFAMVAQPLEFDADASNTASATGQIYVSKPFSTIGLSAWVAMIGTVAGTLTATNSILFAVGPNGKFPVAACNVSTPTVAPFLAAYTSVASTSNTVFPILPLIQGTWILTASCSQAMTDANTKGLLVGSKLISS